MLSVLGGYYLLLVIDFVALYAYYYERVKYDPGFAYTHTEHRDKRTTAIIVISAIIILSYYLWYLLALINNVRLIWRQDKTAKVVFFVN